MTREMTTTIDATDTARLLADKLITFLETGQAPEGWFTADASVDFAAEVAPPGAGRGNVIAARGASHPKRGGRRDPGWTSPRPASFWRSRRPGRPAATIGAVANSCART